MILRTSILFIIALFLLISCLESDLRRSIFFPDPEYPELPKYTEWGYNTFGALVEREPFIHNSVMEPMKVIREVNGTSFLFSGHRGFVYHHNAEMSVKIFLPDVEVNSFDELVALHNTTWDLADDSIDVSITEDGFTGGVDVLSGELQFARVQHLLVDGASTQVILSGFFEFKCIRDGVHLAFTNGRFDIGVADHNFYD